MTIIYFFCLSILMDTITDVKIIKKREWLMCFSYKNNNIPYFAKMFYLYDGSVFSKVFKDEYNNEVKINKYIVENIPEFKYYTKLLKIYEDITPFEFILDYVKDKNRKCNILVYEYAGKYPLRYYINRVSSRVFNDVLRQIKDATEILESHNIIHYDLYCQTNIMLKKENGRWVVKIIDYGLSYIDDSDKTKRDYNIALESIAHFNKKHLM